MSAKYKELLQKLEQEAEENNSSSSTNTTDSKLYPSQIISLEDEENLRRLHSHENHNHPVLLPQGAKRKVRGAQQTESSISEIHYFYSESKNPETKTQTVQVKSLRDLIQNENSSKINLDENNNNEEEGDEFNANYFENETSAKTRTTVTSSSSLTQILPHIPCSILRDRIKQLAPIIRRTIADWRVATDSAGISAGAPFEPSVFPEMPILRDVVEHSDFVRRSLDPCGLASLDAASLATMERVARSNERAARDATENYEQKEHKVLQWVFRSQVSTIRALRADIAQLHAFAQHRDIVMNHCQAVLGCIGASIERVVGCAATERVCTRERLMLNEMGRALLTLTSKTVTAKEEADLNDRLAKLPFREKAIKLYDLVNELTESSLPSLPSFLFLGDDNDDEDENISISDKNNVEVFVDGVGILVTAPSTDQFLEKSEDNNKKIKKKQSFAQKVNPAKVKDLAAAINRIRAAEELADEILREIRQNEAAEESRWSEWNAKYQRAVNKMSSAALIAVEEVPPPPQSADQKEQERNLIVKKKQPAVQLVSVKRSRTIEEDN